MEIVFENEIIRVKKTNQNYDFLAVIENKTNNDISIDIGDESEYYECNIQANDWIGLLNNDTDYELYSAILNNKFYVREK